MRPARLAALFVVAGFLIGGSGVASANTSLGLGEKTLLQAAMQRHISRSLVDGAYLHVNSRTGHVRPLYPVKAHPLIFRMGKYYVLCFDFRDDGGRSVNIDFYIARSGESYRVFHNRGRKPRPAAAAVEGGQGPTRRLSAPFARHAQAGLSCCAAPAEPRITP